MKTWILVFAYLLQSAFAIPEENFLENWHRDVLPHFASGHQRTFINPQGMKLNYFSFTHPAYKKTLVILPGRTEPAVKYAELVFDLKDLGLNIYVLDHQGQGASERLLSDSHKGHVRYFIDYARDLSAWMDEVVVPETQGQERYLLAHSMGGTIGTLYLAYGKDTFKKAVLSSPMMEINTKPYSEKVGRLLTSVLVLARKGNHYAPDRGPYNPDEDSFEKNEVTHSQARFEAAKAIFVTWPYLALGGPTARWVNQSLKATKKIDTITSRIKVPILLFQSGQDLIVKNGRQNAFCHKHHSCQLVRFEQAHHEILQETDEIREQALMQIKQFLAQ